MGGGGENFSVQEFFFSSLVCIFSFWLCMNFFSVPLLTGFFSEKFPLHECFLGIVNPPPVNTKGSLLTPQDEVGVEGQDEANHGF